MKTRTISAFLMLLIFIPILIIGGNLFQLFIFIISLIGITEFLDIKNRKKEIPNFIKFISYMLVSLIILFNIKNYNNVFMIDYKIISALFLTLFVPTVFYHERSKYSINDAFYLAGGILFLGFSMSLLMSIRNIGLEITIYLFLITVITDTYAYITGSLIGKNKMLEVISPKKTWEGFIGGTVFGVLIPTAYYHCVINPELSIIPLVLITLFLSILGQFGDLFFSSIKRYFDKKDFSNLMPGHGGVLDRFDSIIFVVLGYILFISIL
ncbi:MAG TPA: phosphatidate cytidylyltransferase [Tenericutes bacterium]|nr:phosphatidate cytidylyltransferase [Mycoplasmatota bacterium]